VTNTKWLAAASLAVVVFPVALSSSLWAEPHYCPGNVASIRPRFTGRSLIAVPVMLDSTGPYDFVVDTGAQITTIDPRLAAELHPKPLGATHVTGVGSYSQASYAQLASLQAGTYSIKDPLVLVQDMQQIQQTDPRIRGILGSNFLEHFDLLIDYEHRVLCLDDSREMQQKVMGERMAR
jgi:Aspartyl protease